MPYLCSTLPLPFPLTNEKLNSSPSHVCTFFGLLPQGSPPLTHTSVHMLVPTGAAQARTDILYSARTSILVFNSPQQQQGWLSAANDLAADEATKAAAPTAGLAR